MVLNIERLRQALAIPKRDFQHVTGVTGVTPGIFGVTGHVTGAAEHVTDATASFDEREVTQTGNVGLRISVTCQVSEVTRVTPVTYKNTGFGDCVSEDSTVGPPARLKIIPHPDEPVNRLKRVRELSSDLYGRESANGRTRVLRTSNGYRLIDPTEEKLAAFQRVRSKSEKQTGTYNRVLINSISNVKTVALAVISSVQTAFDGPVAAESLLERALKRLGGQITGAN